jgi:hypothetical protein
MQYGSWASGLSAFADNTMGDYCFSQNSVSLEIVNILEIINVIVSSCYYYCY